MRMRMLGVVLVFTVLAVGWAVVSMERANRANQRLTSYHLACERLHRRLVWNESNKSIYARAYASTADEQFKRGWAQATEELWKALEETSDTVGIAPEFLQELTLRITSSRATEESAFRLGEEENAWTSAVLVLNSKAYNELRIKTRACLEKLNADMQRELARLASETDAKVHQGRLALWTASIAVLFGAVVVINSWQRWRRSLLKTFADQAHALEALADSEARFRRAIAGANDGIWDWDLRSGTVFYSPRWKEMLGYGDSEIGSSLEEWFGRMHPEDQDAVEAALEAHLKGHTKYFESEFRMQHSSGEWRWMLARGLAERDESGSPSRIAGSLTDITLRKLTEEQFRHGAYHDPLTDLPNRQYFWEELERVAAKSVRNSHHRFALLYLDLDDFKAINDSYGHAVGDEYLREVARRLRGAVRPQDFVARVGGDEFVVLLDDVESDEAAHEVARRLESALAEPVETGLATLRTTVSIGVAVSTPSERDPATLLTQADQAMYEAKRQRKAQGAADGSHDFGGGL
jgi:diguanylate cyclase (GGDEF)-like protein/PAS domain S-box-containing protein